MGALSHARRFEASFFPAAFSRASVSPLTIDTTEASPELAKALGVAHSTGWKRRSNCPCVSAGQSTLSSWLFPDEAGVPAGPSPGAPFGAPPCKCQSALLTQQKH